MDEKKLPLCIKLDKKTRDEFKLITHDRHTTMQKTLMAFISFYCQFPDRFFIQNNSSFTINDNIIVDNQINEVSNDGTI